MQKFVVEAKEAVVQKCSVKKVFSYECCEISKNTFSHRTPLVAAIEAIIHLLSYNLRDCTFKKNTLAMILLIVT